MSASSAAAPSSRAATDLHCSLSDEESFTDLVTNWVVIGGVDLSADLAGIVTGGRYPEQYLPTFMHELTHHWCFQSPVGQALTALQMRARRNALLLRAVGEEVEGLDSWAMLEDIVRYETTIALLRPIAEGLALFMEFDAAPGHSRLMSRVMSTTALAFMDHAMFEDNASMDDVGGLLRERLRMARLTPRYRERKADLLVQPLKVRGRGYLPGYLNIRNTWAGLLQRTRSDLLFDTDFFAAYLRCYIYDDYALCALLLDPSIELSASGSGAFDAAQRISEHVQQRLIDLSTKLTAAHLTEFEESVVDRKEPTPPPSVILTNPEQDALGRRMLNEYAESIAVEGNPQTLYDRLCQDERWTIEQRHLMCVGSFAAHIEITTSGRVLARAPDHRAPDESVPLLSVAALPEITAECGLGSVEFFLSPTHQFTVLTVTLGKKLVATQSLSPAFTEEHARRLSGYRTGREAAAAERVLRREVVDGAIARDPSLAIYFQHYLTQAAAAADFIHGSRALAIASVERERELADLMAEYGILDVLGGRIETVRAFAQLSLLAAMPVPRAPIVELMSALGFDVEELLRATRECEAKYGLSLVDEREDAVMCRW